MQIEMEKIQEDAKEPKRCKDIIMMQNLMKKNQAMQIERQRSQKDAKVSKGCK